MKAEAESASTEAAAELEKVQGELDALKAEKSTEDAQLAETAEELAKVKAGLQDELDIAANALRGQLASSAQVQEDMHALHAAEVSAFETKLTEAEKINALHKEKSMREHVGGTLGGQFGATMEAMHRNEIKEHKDEIETHKKEIATLRELHLMTNRFVPAWFEVLMVNLFFNFVPEEPRYYYLNHIRTRLPLFLPHHPPPPQLACSPTGSCALRAAVGLAHAAAASGAVGAAAAATCPTIGSWMPRTKPSRPTRSPAARRQWRRWSGDEQPPGPHLPGVLWLGIFGAAGTLAVSGLACSAVVRRARCCVGLWGSDLRVGQGTLVIYIAICPI